MRASCCDHADDPHRGNEGYRRVLWAVLAINAVMFAVEVAAGLAAGSASLQADALDFLGDAGNYAMSLFVVGMALRYRAMAAFLKGATMGLFGIWVLLVTAWHAWHGTHDWDAINNIWLDVRFRGLTRPGMVLRRSPLMTHSGHFQATGVS